LNHLHDKKSEELAEGLRIFKNIEGKWVLEAGRPRKQNQKAEQKPSKEKKLLVNSEDDIKKPKTESKGGKIGFLFPGQGAQEVGMTKAIQTIPEVKQLFDTAKSVLGYDLADLCLKGPKEQLDTTEFSQPAMLIAGLAAVEKLRSEDSKAVNLASGVAGLSLGEYTALVFAGAFTLEDALKVVKIRGEAMNLASKQEKGGMVSIVGLDDNKIREICRKAIELVGDQKEKMVCQIANLNFPKGRVVAGHDICMDKIVDLAQKAGAQKASKLFVSGAFHTELMSSASKALQEALANVTIKLPRIPVYSNVTGEPYTSIEDIRSGLVKQLVSPVQWEQCVDNLIRDGHRQLYELGPRNQLAAMVRRQNQQVGKAVKNVQV